MAIPLKYNIGNLMSRKVSTLMTVLGIGIVIAVMVAMMALYNGVQQALVSSGSKDNLIVLREGAQTEATSWVTRDKYRIIRSLEGIAKASDGEPLISPELVIIFKLPRRDNPTGSNVNVRGVTPKALDIRPYIKMEEGRMFRSGVNEVIVSRRMQERFVDLDLGDTFKFGTHTWNVVGIFDAKGTSFDSEIWADVEQLGLAQKRPEYSSVLLKPVDARAMRAIQDEISTDTRLKLLTKTEHKYYDDQTSGLLGIRILVTIVTFFMVIGATLGAMNTMFSAVASRKRELATMRALGFKRRDVLLSVVIEAIFVSGIAGIVGVLLALPVNGIATGTANFVTFSEVAFNFNISRNVALFAVGLAVVAGVIGGLLPAISAARLPITRALREI
jgi:putative ABC transport system permease protein